MLVGQPASTFSIPPIPLDATPPTVPAQMPSAILERRPDIASAERKAAAANEQVATYRQTVLTAFQDVEDNLASLRLLEKEIVLQEQAVQSAQQALAIINNQYKAGTVAYINVLTAQTTAFTAEQKLANIAGQRMVSSVWDW